MLTLPNCKQGMERTKPLPSSLNVPTASWKLLLRRGCKILLTRVVQFGARSKVWVCQLSRILMNLKNAVCEQLKACWTLCPLPKHFFTSVMQLMHNAMCRLQVWNQLLVTCLNTPPWPTWGHSMQSYDRAPRPPPFNQITQQGCQSTGLELRIPIFFRYFVKLAQ